jgi:hypothetical protein
MTYINVAYHKQYELPIAASHSWEGIMSLIVEYIGGDKELSWHPSNSKFPDSYEGYFEYTDSDGEIEQIKIYAVDFR